MTTAHGSFARKRWRRASALALTVICGVTASAHRRDEYLQAARIAVARESVELQLDLTPGIDVSERVIADLDVDRDGVSSARERDAYARAVVDHLKASIDGQAVQLQIVTSAFPDGDTIRRGEGTIALRIRGTFARLAAGRHDLLFRDDFDPDDSVYLANALVPESRNIAVHAQQRDGDQRELTIAYEVIDVRSAGSLVGVAGLGGAALTLVLVQRRRSWHGGLTPR